MDTTWDSTGQQPQNPTPAPTQCTPLSTSQSNPSDPPQDPPQLSEWQITRKATSRGLGAVLPTYEPDYAKIGEPFVVPEAHAGDSDRPPGEWARFIWRAAFKVARRGESLKGQLPMLLKQEPVRELMARERYFAGGRREDEILGNHLANVESAAVFCQGEVKTNEHRQSACNYGRAKGIFLPAPTASGMDNLSDASFWKRAQAPLTPGDQIRGHQRNKRSISKKMAYEAWADMKRNLDMLEELTVEIAEAHATEQWTVVGTLVKQQQRWLDNLKRPLGILDQFHPAEPNPPQQPEGT
ncbi:uncharacterized protein PGRI_035790 [Penicillium griseofulvum]|uniref:Uncharacterized protein n=1 Tax=Penicillium patulum TaxID=5078 RepID=A0A135LCZ2_PENPA|nr:uncharacterized protein PGRI_035790 [Penicillium griseofulvum]KXG46833.1 hypothetical protein PGRI_035790 [Penicillium griseofulvum]